jgi:Zn-dependent alcohol dehydrogenase
VGATAVTAAVVESAGAPFALQELELGDLQPTEVRLRIAASGICHTDMLIRDGSFPTPMPGCGIQTGAGSVINAVRPKAGSSIAVFGVGEVGLSAIMGAVICGCDPIIAVDVLPSRLDLARELGATHIRSTPPRPIRSRRSSS